MKKFRFLKSLLPASAIAFVLNAVLPLFSSFREAYPAPFGNAVKRNDIARFRKLMTEVC